MGESRRTSGRRATQGGSMVEKRVRPSAGMRALRSERSSAAWRACWSWRESEASARSEGRERLRHPPRPRPRHCCAELQAGLSLLDKGMEHARTRRSRPRASVAQPHPRPPLLPRSVLSDAGTLQACLPSTPALGYVSLDPPEPRADPQKLMAALLAASLLEHLRLVPAVTAPPSRLLARPTPPPDLCEGSGEPQWTRAS